MRWQVTILLAGVFFHGKLRPMKKTPREDVHSREEETCRKRPRETPECAKAHSFLCGMHKSANRRRTFLFIFQVWMFL